MPEALSIGFARRVLFAIAIVVLALFLWSVRDAILLGFAAVLLAVAIHGIADVFATHTKLPKTAALALAALLLVAALASVLWLFGAQLASQLSAVFESLPAAWERARESLGQGPLGQRFMSEVDAFLAGEGAASFQDVLARAGSYTLPLASGLTTALLVIFAAAFLTAGAGAYREGLVLLAPKGVDAQIGEALDASARALKKWLLGITIDMFVIATLLAIALWALGVPAFIGLALIAGLAQFVPTVGPLLAAIPGILLAFTVSPMTALWTALAYLTISQLEANLIYPIVQKKTAAIPPALNLLAILAFGMLLGPLGVLLATPILVVATVFVVLLYIRGALGKDAEVPGA